MILNFFKEDKKVTKLKFGESSNIEEEGAKILAQIFISNTTLTQLDISLKQTNK